MGREHISRVAFEALNMVAAHIEKSMKNGSLSKTEGVVAMASVGAFLTESAGKSLSPENKSLMYFVCSDISTAIQGGG